MCTAAGYPGNAARYEQRLKGLLDGFIASNLTDEELTRFMVMGGECNYLLGVKKTYDRDSVNTSTTTTTDATPALCANATVGNDDGAGINLEFIDEEQWKDGRGVRWDKDDIQVLLDRAELAMREISDALRLKVDILRKERSIGMVNKSGVYTILVHMFESISM